MNKKKMDGLNQPLKFHSSQMLCNYQLILSRQAYQMPKNKNKKSKRHATTSLKMYAFMYVHH
jgi:hypothetical protein